MVRASYPVNYLTAKADFIRFFFPHVPHVPLVTPLHSTLTWITALLTITSRSPQTIGTSRGMLVQTMRTMPGATLGLVRIGKIPELVLTLLVPMTGVLLRGAIGECLPRWITTGVRLHLPRQGV